MWPRFCLLVLTWTQVQCGADIHLERKVPVNLTDSLEKLDVTKNHDFDSKVSTLIDLILEMSEKLVRTQKFCNFILCPI